MNDLDIHFNAPEGAGPEELAAYLDEACAGDAALRARVEALFQSAARDKGNDFMERTPPGVEPMPKAKEGLGTIIGNYKLLQEIGEGGFGVVYMADQLRPVKRRVALKIIKLGMDTRQIVARFEVERQALAMMDHPNIAKVHDAGVTESGRPYFVMELVRGIPITKFCEEKGLDTEARLALFVDVCGAIQHAHQKGIIHRDLKPSNVIVTLHDDKAVPKVIDFGVAKATQQDLTDKTLFTQFEQFIGTPAYMSPEQAQMSGLDIDTRSDIYALGVLLYELLTSTTPFDPKSLAEAGQDEVRRLIREEDPPKPSTRLTELQKRHLDHPDVALPCPNVDRELDWIVMKALEKDRTRRYETANGLAADVRRHLNHEPVEAGPPGLSYRLAKTLRRHRAAVLTAAAMLILSVTGATISTWQWLRARKTAVAAEISATEAEIERARASDNERIATHRMVEELFASGKPNLAITHLAYLIRNDPGNRVAGERLMSALRHWTIPRSLSPPLPGISGNLPLFASGDYVVGPSHDKKGFRVYDTESGLGRGQEMVLPAGLRPALAFLSSDEKFVLICGGDRGSFRGHVQLWDWRRGKPIGPPSEHSDLVNVIRISPDGEMMLAADASGVVRVWSKSDETSWEDKRLVGNLEIRSAEFSADSEWVVIGDDRGHVRIRETKTGRDAVPPLEHGSPVTATRINTSRTLAVTAGIDGRARIWNLNTGAQVGDTIDHQDQIAVAEFSPDGRFILTGSWDRTAGLWEVSSGEPVGDLMRHDGKVVSAHFSSNGRRIVTATEQTFRVWNAGMPGPVGEKVSNVLIHAASFDEHGDRVLVSSQGSPSRVWKVPRGQPVSQKFCHAPRYGTDRFSEAVEAARFRFDGRQIITSGGDGTSRSWDIETGEQTAMIKRGQFVFSVDYSGDGMLAASASNSGVYVWDPRTGELLQPLTGMRKKSAQVKFSPCKDDAGRWRLATMSTGDDAAVQLWDASLGDSIGPELKLAPGRGVVARGFNFIDFSHDGKRIAAVAGDETAYVWQVMGAPETWKQLSYLTETAESPGHQKDLWGIRFNHDGTRVVTASLDGTARIWDVFSGKQVCPALQHSKGVLDACFSPDGKSVATASIDGTAQIWNAATGEPLELTLRQSEVINRVRFSPDGSRLVTAGFDRTARVWDSASGLPLSELLRHNGWIFDAEFSPDGRKVVTAGTDATVRVWDVPPIPLEPVPDWVTHWAEALVGLRINTQGRVDEIDWETRKKLEDEARSHAGEDEYYGRTVEWYYEDSKTRKITPFSKLPVSDYIKNRLKDTNLKGLHREDSLEEVLRIDPDNIEAYAKLAEFLLKVKRSDKAMDLRRARYYAGLVTAAEPGNREHQELFTRIEAALAAEAIP